jgi:succinate dehydrogenase/fumarate reductase-like Fe-S protein
MGSEKMLIVCDGHPVPAAEGMTVAAALLHAGAGRAFCGMGVCMECRVRIDGKPHRLACQTLCRPGMEVATQ